jgi:hypothetical protein
MGVFGQQWAKSGYVDENGMNPRLKPACKAIVPTMFAKPSVDKSVQQPALAISVGRDRGGGCCGLFGGRA